MEPRDALLRTPLSSSWLEWWGEGARGCTLPTVSTTGVSVPLVSPEPHKLASGEGFRLSSRLAAKLPEQAEEKPVLLVPMLLPCPSPVLRRGLCPFAPGGAATAGGWLAGPEIAPPSKTGMEHEALKLEVSESGL